MSEMIGVIEAPINKMMKAYPDEFLCVTQLDEIETLKKGKS